MAETIKTEKSPLFTQKVEASTSKTLKSRRVVDVVF